MRITLPRLLAVVLLILLVAVGVYFLPPVHARLAWRVDELRSKIVYFFNPPDEAIFQPSEQSMLGTIVAQTMQAYQTPLSPTRTPAPIETTGPTVEPTATSTPLPSAVELEGVKYEDQHGRNNYCGPANFSMALNYWGWNGNRDIIGQALMPGNNTGKDGRVGNSDKNVMPYELQDFIAQRVPGMTSIIRYGGDVDVLRRMIAAGFPVVVEKGIYEKDMNGKFSWMGHYAFVTGYEDASQELVYQDTYQPEGAPPGRNRRISFEEFIEGWRSFNYVFVVVYPYEREAQVLTLLGDYADENWAARHALDIADNETRVMASAAEYFAWFNKGTSHVALFEYADAASAYDKAFQIYAELGGDETLRPYRMMWYQTGPYRAYFYSGRYTDVVNLANNTFQTISSPILEESLYWRAQAEYMLGDTKSALADYRAALAIHPGWEPAVVALQDLGVTP
jgi:uncharacterized protein YvpB